MAAVSLRLSYATGFCRPSSFGCVRIAATVSDGEVARVSRQHRRRAGSNVRSTGAEERACFSASKLSCAAAVHVKRAIGLPSAVNGAASSE